MSASMPVIRILMHMASDPDTPSDCSNNVPTLLASATWMFGMFEPGDAREIENVGIGDVDGMFVLICF